MPSFCRRLIYRLRQPALGLSAVVLSMGLAACGDRGSTANYEGSYEDPSSRAQRLSKEIVIVDTHIDVPYRLVEEMEDVSVATEGGDFDYPRAVAGGLDAPFMSIYVPASFQESGGARQEADRLIDLVEEIVDQSSDKFALARSPADIEAQVEAGLMSLPMGMENGAPIEDELANLSHFYERGIRYITLTHSENNLICDSSYSEEPTWEGLSPFGREVVAEMNRLGIMIDISHVSDAAFYQVVELSEAPVIASHSSSRHFTPGFERNMDDDMIRALAANGGVIHINFGSAFLTAESNRDAMTMWKAMAEFADERGLDFFDPEVRAKQQEYRQTNPAILADVSDVADHIDHVVGLVGFDHVGIGSDFDGVNGTAPVGLRDVSAYPNLIRTLLVRGYSDDEIRKIFGGNTLRVWDEVEKVAAEASG